MAYLRTKKIGGHIYGYIVTGKRKDGKVKQEIVKSLGRIDPSPESNLKLAVLPVQDNGTISISISRKLKGEFVLVEYSYQTVPDKFAEDVKELIRNRNK